MFHPEQLNRAFASIVRRKALELSRCVKACFLDDDGNATLEAQRTIADLRKFAKMDEHAFLRDLQGRVDPLSMARIEGRREAVRRLINFLNLDPLAVEQFVEVDNGRE